MTCSDFVAGYSDVLDGLVSVEDRDTYEAHRDRCQRCQRYAAVVERGAQVLRALPEPRLTEDFGHRLQHRLYHVDDESLAGQSFAPALTVLGMALFLTALAWAPTLLSKAPVVAMEPVVVDQAPRSPVRSASTNAMPERTQRPQPLPVGGLFDDGQALMYEYSPLSQRYRQRAALRRASMERDR